ncbi:MAG: amidohydrolase family protein [Bradymonadaceae bacterium]
MDDRLPDQAKARPTDPSGWVALCVGLLAFASMLVAAPAPAVAVEAYTGATIHTGTGKTIEGGTIVVGDDGRIRRVTGDRVDLPPDAEIVELEGVVTPGFIDARTHLGLPEIWAVGRTRDQNRGGGPVRAAFRTADAFNATSVALPITRTGGVTSAVIVPGGGWVSGQSAWIDLRGGEHRFGRVAQESTAIHIDATARNPKKKRTDRLRSRAGVLEKLRELYDDAAFFQKHRKRFNKNRTRPLMASRLDLIAIGRTFEGKLPVVFRAHRASDIRRALEFADAHGLDPIVAGGAEAWMVAERLAERNVPVIVDPHLNLPTRFETLGARSDNAALLADAGVPVVISTFGTHNVRKLRQLAGNAVRAGMEHGEALAAVTANPARAFGLGGTYGTLRKGRRANFVVWSGDPFELSTDVRRMYIDGRRVSLDNRQQRLFERYRRLEGRGEPPEPIWKTPDSEAGGAD